MLILDKGLFTNYDGKILAIFDHLPTCIDIFYGMNFDKKWTLLATYLPRLVNVVCERPLIQKVADFCFKILREKQKQQLGQILGNLFKYHNMVIWWNKISELWLNKFFFKDGSLDKIPNPNSDFSTRELLSKLRLLTQRIIVAPVRHILEYMVML